MITQAPEDAGIGAKTRQFPNGVVKGVAELRDEVAGDNGQMRLQLVEHVDGAAEFAGTEPGADMEIAQLANAQTFEVGMQVRHRQIDFPDLEVGSFDDRGEPHDCEWRGGGDRSSGPNHPATPGECSTVRLRVRKRYA